MTEKGVIMKSLSKTNVQLKLLQLYTTGLPEKDIIERRAALANFYAEKSIQLANKVWNEKGFGSKDMDAWLNEKS